MTYQEFHQICLDILISSSPRRYEGVSIINHNSTQLRVKNLTKYFDPVARYYRAYNNAKWDEQPSIGFSIDRFVVAHEVESRYAEEGWDRFDSRYSDVHFNPAEEVMRVINRYPYDNTEFMAEMTRMHQDNKITCNDFNYYGGSMYHYTYKTFKEMYDTLKKYGIIEASKG